MAEKLEIPEIPENSENLEIRSNSQNPSSPSSPSVLTKAKKANYGTFKSQRVEEASSQELRNVEGKVIGRRIAKTREQVRKAYALIDSLLPSAIGCVEKLLINEMARKKRDGYLILSIAKFLANKRLPDVGKIEALPDDRVELELDLPKKKAKTDKTEQATVMLDSENNALRVTSNQPIDLKIRQSSDNSTGPVVEIEDCTEDGFIDSDGNPVAPETLEILR